MTRRLAPLLTVFVILTGCSTMAPRYERPVPPVEAAWPSGPSYGTGSPGVERPLADIPWQEFFTDPKLNGTIALALDNNRDLRVAVLTIERVRALYQIQRSDLFPKINATGGATFQRLPEDFSNGRSTTTESYDVGLGLSSYEVDLFGRVRSLKDQALEQYLSTEQARRSVQIGLVAETAFAWLNLAADQERLQLARETLSTQQESFRLTKSRFDAGVSSALELNQSRTSVEGARADIARYTTLVAQDVNALNLIAGMTVPVQLHPGSLSESLTAVKSVSPGLPSDVLLDRPDILQAEHQLKSANANIGAARANFFPRVTLTSSVGFGSSDLAGLFTGGAFTWGISPRISIPIFEGGANRATLQVSEADRDIAVARYEKAIQTAFREVSDALARAGTISDQLAAQQALTDATAESHTLSMARYERGVDSYLQVLDAQRSLYGAQQNLINVRLARLENQVALYRVLGGGAR